MSFSTTKLDHRHGRRSPKDTSCKDVRALDCERQTEIASVEDDEEVQMDDVSAPTDRHRRYLFSLLPTSSAMPYPIVYPKHTRVLILVRI